MAFLCLDILRIAANIVHAHKQQKKTTDYRMHSRNCEKKTVEWSKSKYRLYGDDDDDDDDFPTFTSTSAHSF